MAKAMGKLSHQPKTSIAFICLDLGIDPAPNANTAFGWRNPCHLLIIAGAQPATPW